MAQVYWLFLFSCICIFWFSCHEYILLVQWFKTVKNNERVFTKSVGKAFWVGSKAGCGEGPSTFQYWRGQWWEDKPLEKVAGHTLCPICAPDQVAATWPWRSWLSGASGVSPAIWLPYDFHNLGLSFQWLSGTMGVSVFWLLWMAQAS